MGCRTPESRSGHSPPGSSGAVKRFALAPKHPTLRVPSGRPPAAIRLGKLDAVLLLQAVQHEQQTVLPISRNRSPPQGSERVQLTPRDPRPFPPPATAQHRRTSTICSRSTCDSRPGCSLAGRLMRSASRRLAFQSQRRLGQLITASRSAKLVFLVGRSARPRAGPA
jgi:hypothetical protein